MKTSLVLALLLMVQSVIFVATVGLKLGLSSLGPMVAWMVTGWVFNSVCVGGGGGWGGETMSLPYHAGDLVRGY